MPNPIKIKLIPDDYHIENAGILKNGDLFFIDIQLAMDGGSTRDFVCTYVFDPDGNLQRHTIDDFGLRGSYVRELVRQTIDRRLGELGPRTKTDIWVRLFQVAHKGRIFGLVSREPDEDVPDEGVGCSVDLMPGYTLNFYPPWEEGEYDT